MKATDRLRALMLRWDGLLAALAILLPLLAALVAGFLWMAGNGLLIPYIAASISFGGAVALVRIGVRRWRRRKAPQAPDRDAAGVPPDPEWDEGERRAYASAVALIRTRTQTPVPWPELQPLAMDVVKAVAAASGPAGKQPLDFTLPEALLLAERVSGRLRGDLRRRVPFSDSVSLRTLHWLWRNRGWGQATVTGGRAVWRVVRMIKSPPAAILREIDDAIAGGNSGYLTEEAMAIAQSVLLEELARTAVDLYSGRLRFSESELLEMRLAYGDLDRQRLAMPDAPLRIAVAGQVSVGKSSLINALLGADRAEVDAPPTTATAATYPAEIDGVDCVLLDLPGLDGGAQSRDAVLREMATSDVVIWVARADRPSREIDRAVLEAWRARLKVRPELRKPPLICVASGMDRLAPEWPYPEHNLPQDVAESFGHVAGAIADTLGTGDCIPLSLTAPEWNLASLHHRLGSVLAEGLMVQRNRARIDGGVRSLTTEAARAASGLKGGLTGLGRRIRARAAGTEGSKRDG